jgi:biopolymer transport protein ExbB/TolQ
MASTSTTSTRDHKTRSGNGNLAAFLVGLPLAAAILAAFHFTALRETPAARYVSHTVEQVEVVLFSCALGALAAKILHSLSERRAWKQPILPAWQGGAVPVAEATPLLAGLTRLSPRLQDTTLTRRVEAVLRFLCQRGSAAELDDHLRALADSDVIAQENSYSLIRFLTWAMPILGFLGTVLGITQAISGVTPEVLEKDLSRVTDGLALAFDATALALAMTMGTMFLTFLVERAEQSLLEAVDRYADQHLAHRFERLAGDSGLLVEATRRNTQVLIDATNELINRQAELWGKSLEEADRRRAAADRVQHERVAAVLETAIERTVQAHAQRLAALAAASWTGWRHWRWPCATRKPLSLRSVTGWPPRPMPCRVCKPGKASSSGSRKRCRPTCLPWRVLVPSRKPSTV